MKIHDAERAIWIILANVELEYQSAIDSIELQDIEVMKMGETIPQLKRFVRIKIKSRPVDGWLQAEREAR